MRLKRFLIWVNSSKKRPWHNSAALCKRRHSLKLPREISRSAMLPLHRFRPTEFLEERALLNMSFHRARRFLTRRLTRMKMQSSWHHIFAQIIKCSSQVQAPHASPVVLDEPQKQQNTDKVSEKHSDFYFRPNNSISHSHHDITSYIPVPTIPFSFPFPKPFPKLYPSPSPQNPSPQKAHPNPDQCLYLSAF